MRCVPLLAFWGQFGYSLHCVITRSLYGFLLCVVDFLFYVIYFLVITCQLHLLSGETMDAEEGSQGANPALTIDLSTKAPNINLHLVVVWNKD